MNFPLTPAGPEIAVSLSLKSLHFIVPVSGNRWSDTACWSAGVSCFQKTLVCIAEVSHNRKHFCVKSLVICFLKSCFPWLFWDLLKQTWIDSLFWARVQWMVLQTGGVHWMLGSPKMLQVQTDLRRCSSLCRCKCSCCQHVCGCKSGPL